MQETAGLLLGKRECDDVDGGETSLLARRHKHYDRFDRRVSVYLLVDWLHHGQQTRMVVSDVEALRNRMKQVDIYFCGPVCIFISVPMQGGN